MALLLNEAEVRNLLTMPLAIEATEESFQRLADGSAVLHSRRRLYVPGKSYLHYMAAADPAGGTMGMKIYTSSKNGLRFLIPLFDVQSGDLLALIEADYLGQMRTGAASAVATRLLARADAHTVGIVGTGQQARTQLAAIAQVRRIDRVRAFSRNAEHRERFAAEMTRELGFEVTAADSAEAVVRGADIVVTSTTSATPVVLGSWLAAGTHINAIGANFPQKRELDDDAVRRADVIAVDSREQAKMEAGDLIDVFGKDPVRWEAVRELAEIVGGDVAGREYDDQITLFKSSGIAIEDVVTATRVYNLARQRGIGREIPMWSGEARPGVARAI